LVMNCTVIQLLGPRSSRISSIACRSWAGESDAARPSDARELRCSASRKRGWPSVSDSRRCRAPLIVKPCS